MNKALAEELMLELTKSARCLDAAELISRKIEDETVRMEFRRAIATLGASYTDIFYRIFAVFPELEPESKEKSE